MSNKKVSGSKNNLRCIGKPIRDAAAENPGLWTDRATAAWCLERTRMWHGKNIMEKETGLQM